ncbi:MAG TPA: MraY family glycosyltransferase [Terriglobales bacterium]|nr:MraY family glycosyltransferase [Terriglobales bacterium]
MFWLLASVANAALVISLALTWIVRQLARSRGWMAAPESERHVHEIPIPRLGGVAIFLSVALTTLILAATQWESRFSLLCLIPATWMFAIGLTDDVHRLRASRKLLAQLVAGGMLFALGLRVPAGSGQIGFAISLVATILWCVTLTNAINLVDGLDALASGSATCSIIAMLVAALCFGQHDTAILAATLAGAVLGFLRFNIPPATIFLGDSGSLTLGILVSAISIRLVQASKLGWIVCLLALAHPLAEVFLSSTRRFLTANPIFRPDRRHMHHRLLDRSLSHGQSAATLVAISFSFAFLGTLALGGGLWVAIAIVLAILKGAYVIRAFHYHEFPLFAMVVKRIADHRYTTDAHLQLREVAQALEKTPPESFRQLRRITSELLLGFGFAEAVLVVPELNSLDRPIADRGVTLDFPLCTRLETIGWLRVRWDLHCTMPIDLSLFAAEFLPVLTRMVQWHLEAHREATRPLAFSIRKSQRPQLVASLREIDSAKMTPLQN